MSPAASDEFVVDLTDFKDRIGGRVPPGRYRVVVDDCEMDESKNKNPMVIMWFRILDGEFKDTTIIDRLTQTPNALFRTVGFMQAIGLPTPRKRFTFRLSQWKGKVLEIDVRDGDPFNGRVKSEVEGYIKIERGASSGMADLPEPGSDEFEAGLAEFSKGGDVPADVNLEEVDLG